MTGGKGMRVFVLLLLSAVGCATLPQKATLTDPKHPKDGKIGLIRFPQQVAAAWGFEGSLSDFIIAAENRLKSAPSVAVAGVLLSSFDYEAKGKIRGQLFLITKNPPQNAQTLIMPATLVAAITHIGNTEMLTEKFEILREWTTQQGYAVVGAGRIILFCGGTYPILEVQYPVTPK